MEVLRGVKLSRVFMRMSAFFDVLQNVPTDDRLWEEAAELAWELDGKGWIIPAPDVLIACAARRIGAVVLTSDRHFQKIPGIAVRTWD